MNQNHYHISNVLDPSLEADERIVRPDNTDAAIEEEHEEPPVRCEDPSPVQFTSSQDPESCENEEKVHTSIQRAAFQVVVDALYQDSFAKPERNRPRCDYQKPEQGDP